MSRPRLTRLVIATHNRKKAGEMIQILSKRFPPLEFRTLADYPKAPEPDETGSTYAENAAIKAESAAEATGEWALADDAGLEIDALGGEPGLMSKRFAGEDTAFPEKMRRILELMNDVPEPSRTARFRCCVALGEPPAAKQARQDKARTSPRTPYLFEAICEGRIAFEPSGAGGFGYDPIFYLPELRSTMANLSAEEKHSVSHRGKVLMLLGDYMEATFELP
ncbi:MAG: RdgB/HAM1 family non-canonical purine NTP pyrophosphatase [Fimbriimonadales bacterium]